MTVEQLFCKNCLHTIITSKHKDPLSNWTNILLNFFCAPPDFWSQDAGVLPWLASNCLFAFCLTQSSLLHTIFTISLPHFSTNYTNISPQSTSHSSEINQGVAMSQTKDLSLRNPLFWGWWRFVSLGGPLAVTFPSIGECHLCDATFRSCHCSLTVTKSCNFPSIGCTVQEFSDGAEQNKIFSFLKKHIFELCFLV